MMNDESEKVLTGPALHIWLGYCGVGSCFSVLSLTCQLLHDPTQKLMRLHIYIAQQYSLVDAKIGN